MDQLAPSNVPVYETTAEGRSVWQRCAERGLPVVAVREGDRGFIVRYDVQHLERELSADALRKLRAQVRSVQSSPVSVGSHPETDALDGETGQIAGELHVENEAGARRLASRVSAFVFDDDNLV